MPFAAVISSGCLGVAIDHGRGGDSAGQEILEVQFGVAAGSSIGKRASSSALALRIGGGADFASDGLGFGLRGGLIADSRGAGDGKSSFGGLGISGHVALSADGGWIYTGLGYIVGLDDAALQVDGKSRDVDGMYAYLGARAPIWEITERLSYNLVIEMGPTWSFETDLGAYSSFDFRFGTILTF